MTLTLPIGSFTCKKCILTFDAEYKPQQRPRKSCPKCHKMVGITPKIKIAQKGNSGRATNNKSNQKQPPQVEGLAKPPTITFIDDPNELLMSCAMRELNKATPDVRWGNILLTLLDKTKQLESKSKTEVMIRRKLVKYSSNQLIELRKKLIKS